VAVSEGGAASPKKILQAQKNGAKNLKKITKTFFINKIF
jgi:hypothetical protein